MIDSFKMLCTHSPCKSARWLTYLFSYLLFVSISLTINSNSFAGTITLATGGNAISADTTSAVGGSGAWTSLSGPSYQEAFSKELSLGTVILTIPPGFEFNVASTVNVVLSAGDKNANKNLNGTSVGGLIATASVTKTSITFNITAQSKGNAIDTISWQGIQVRPTNGTPLAIGNITSSGSSGIGGVSNPNNFGTLIEVAGIAVQLAYQTQPSNTIAANPISPAIVVQIQDKFGNLANTNNSSVSLAIGTNPSGGALVGTTTTAVAGVATFNNSSIDKAGSGYTLIASSTGLKNITSNPFNIMSSLANFDAVEVGAAPATKLFTKLVGVGFSVDIIALNSSNGISSAYTGTVTVKLVDASTGGGICSSMLVLQNISVTSFKSGRMTVSLTYSNAARNVRIRVNDASAGVTACSTDNFSIRPTGFTSINSTMTNSSSVGTPSAVAGSGAFAMTADTGLAGYDGTPKIDNTALQAHSGAIQNGNLIGVFAAASSGAASASSLIYTEVGNFRMLGSIPTIGDNLARGIYDDSFTAVDAGDCTNDFSNTLTGGKYGCKFGITANSAYFGRFYPASFTLTISSLIPACSAVSGFTYMGQSFTATATIQALNGASTPLITKNYNGIYANGTALFAAVNNNNGVDLSSRLTIPAGTWTAGIYTLNTTAAIFSLPTTAIADASWGPFDGMLIGVRIADPDGITLNARDMNPTTSGTCISCTHKALSAATRMRLGRLRMSNAYGSELLTLPIPIEAQYWSSTYYSINTLDSCTNIPASSFIYSNFQAPLTACATHTSLTGVMSNGRATNNLTAPGSGNSGSVNLSINTSTSASGSTCTSGGPAVPATAANFSWFVNSPSAKATFGIRKTKLIYLRENF